MDEHFRRAPFGIRGYFVTSQGSTNPLRGPEFYGAPSEIRPLFRELYRCPFRQVILSKIYH